MEGIYIPPIFITGYNFISELFYSYKEENLNGSVTNFIEARY